MVDKNDNDRDGQPKKKRGLFAGLLSRQVPAPATTARRALGTAPHDRNDDAQEASPVTTEKEVGAEAATSSIDTARPAQPEAVVDTEAVQADIAAVAPPRAEAPADDAGDVSAAESGPIPAQLTTTSLIFHAPEILPLPARPGRRRHDDEWDDRDDRDDRDDDDRDQRDDDRDDDDRDEPQRGTSRRRQRGRSQDREERDSEQRQGGDRGDRRERPQRQVELITEPQRIKGSTRLEA